ncbi:MAG: hypothetical protein R3F60_15585 [bacterium]
MVEELGHLLARPRLKVTVHKEALRLLGALRTPRAVAYLHDQWTRPDLHRDVRIAALHAARALLDLEEAWALLGEACTHPAPDVARALLAPAPATLPARHRDRYLATLLQPAHPPGRSGAPRALRPPARSSLACRTGGADRPRSRGGAGGSGQRAGVERGRRVLAEVAEAEAVWPVVVEVSRALVAEAAAADPEPAADDDQPARRRLGVLAQCLAGAGRERRRPVLGAVAAVLATLPGADDEVAMLRVESLEPGAPVEAAHALAGWLEVASERGRWPLEAATARLADVSGRWTLDALAVVIERLGAGNPSGFAALRLVEALGRRLEAPAWVRQRLGSLRRAADPALAAAALAVRF